MGDSQLAQVLFSGSEDKSSSELGGAIPLVVNAIPDAAGVARRRPSVVPWVPFTSNVTGYPYYPGNGQVIGMLPFLGKLVYATSDGRLSALTPNVIRQGLTYGVPGTQHELSILAGGGRPSLVAGRAQFLAAAGAQIMTWDGVAALFSRLQNTGATLLVGTDGYSVPTYPPPSAFALSAIAQRLLVGNVPGSSGQIHWSGPLEDYGNWDYALGGASYAQAAAKPDPLVWIADNTNELFAFGTETIQVFDPASLAIDVNDPNVILDFAPNRTQNIGTISPYSIIAMDDNFVMLDRQRRIILTDARTYQDIGQPVSQLLRDMQSVTDCWGFRMRFGRFDCLVWMFPTDGFGLIYDNTSSRWAEWRMGGVNEGPVTITSAYNWAEQGAFLVGLSGGTIAQLSDSSTEDLGVPIKIELISGFTTHGTQAQKHCRTMLFQFKRTWAATAGSGHVRISRRDTQGAWQIIRDQQLESTPYPCIQIRSLGVYRTRQWKVEYTGSDELQLVSAQEEYEILGA